jgi:hypothetical protein
MQGQGSIRSSIASSRFLLLSLVLATPWAAVSHSPSLKACDTYSVQLQAIFPDHSFIPCSDEETIVIEAILHSVVQLDVIVGLYNGLPIRNFFLAFSTFGDNVTEWEFYNETDYMNGSQYQLSQPYLTAQDVLEDMYYEYSTGTEEGGPSATHVHNTTVPTTESVETFVPSDTDTLAPSEASSADVQTNTTVAPSEAPLTDIQTNTTAAPSEAPLTGTQTTVTGSNMEDKVAGSTQKKLVFETPPPIELFEGSLREGPKHNVPCVDGACAKRSIDATGCDADWCAWFLTEPCDAIPHSLAERTPQYQAMMKRFQERVAYTIEKKLRKWARDIDCMCLGNSWQLKALVKRLR